MLGSRRMVNPLLGVYYGIFTAGYIGLAVMLLILEYMGVIEGHINYALTATAFFLAAVIAIASTTRSSDEFFTSGRRVPAGLNGLVILVVSLGGAGLSGLLGTVFFLGIDGYGLMLGLLAGVMLSGVLIAACLRKAGAYTLASFYEIRYSSRFAGALSSLFLLVPMMLFALAEFTLLKTLAPFILGISGELAMLAVGGAVLLLLIPGGVRSLSWSHCALAIVVLLGLMLPLVLISLDLTNLPLAQMTYGSLIDDVAKFETVSKTAEIRPVWPLLIGGEGQPVRLSFIGGERALGVTEIMAMFVVFAAGIAGMPAVLARSGVTFSVFEARKSFAWGAALLGLVILTVPAYAVFMRYMLFDPQSKFLLSSLPEWADSLSRIGLLQVVDGDDNGVLAPRELYFKRDAVLIGLPMMAGLSQTLLSLIFAGLMAASVGGLAARVLSISQNLARDLNPRKAAVEADVVGASTLLWTRLVILMVTVGLGYVAYLMEVDAFQLFTASVLMAALIVFPALVLSLWWRGMTKVSLVMMQLSALLLGGAILALTAGGIAPGPLGFSVFELAVLAMLLVCLIGWVAGLIGPKATAEDLEAISEIRMPGGEVIYDRMLRLAMPRRGIGSG